MLNKDLDIFLKLFDYKPKPLKADKIKQAKQIISKYKIPDKYLEGLDKEQKFLRQIELISKKRQTSSQRQIRLKTDKIIKHSKTSICTEKWNKMFPEAKTNLQKSKITGIPKSILDKVENKGRGAFYSSGSRPGQTAISWGIARVNCFIMNKKSVTHGPDEHLYLQALKYPKAKKWFTENLKNQH